MFAALKKNRAFERFARPAGAPPWVLAHRGLHDTVPENTTLAFERAFDARADAVELDVRLSRDGHVVVFHDQTLRRMAQRPEFVCDLPLAALRRVALPAGARIPTLDEALDVVSARDGRVNVELKGILRREEPYFAPEELRYRVELARRVARVLSRRSDAVRARVLYSTFDPVVFTTLGALVREPVAFLFDRAHTGVERAERWMRVVRPRAVHPEADLCTPARIAAWREHARLVNPWTVNDPSRAAALAAMGVDGIVTDRPAEIRAALR